MFGWNLLLALAWCAAWGRISMAEVAIGFVVGYAVLGCLLPGDGTARYVRRVPRVLAFACVYLVEVVRSTLLIAWDVVSPRPHHRPGILAAPLGDETDLEIAVLANLITFTPGTVALDVSRDRRVLFVHDMFIHDPESSREHIRNRYGRWVRGILR
jgi:multicomponent Na+:H+ antiporter subunit E